MDMNKPRIAVIYASAQGSTREIAEFIGAVLSDRGAAVEIADVDHAPDLSRFDGVVLGSAVHDRAFLPAAAAFVHHHRDDLALRTVWLFSAGIDAALRGPIGRRVAHHVPKAIAALRDSISAIDYRAFAGHYERIGVDLPARIRYRLLGGARYGDLRDWTAIAIWAGSIADTLRLPRTQTSVIHP